MGLLLKPVLQNSNILIMSLLSLSMMIIGTIEVSHFKLQTRVNGLFWVVFICISIGCTLITSLGCAFAIQSSPFYNPKQFLPVLGMLLGNSITGTSLALRTLLDQLVAHRDRIEFYLSLGGNEMGCWKVCCYQSLQNGSVTVSQFNVNARFCLHSWYAHRSDFGWNESDSGSKVSADCKFLNVCID